MNADLMEYNNDESVEQRKFSKEYPNCTKLLNNNSSVFATGVIGAASPVTGPPFLSTTSSDILNLNLTGSTAAIGVDYPELPSSVVSLKKRINGDCVNASIGQRLAANGLNTSFAATCDAADGLCKLATAVLLSSSASLTPDRTVIASDDNSFCRMEDEEDIIDGFSFRSFETYSVLEECLRREEAKSKTVFQPLSTGTHSTEVIPAKKAEKKRAKRNKENRSSGSKMNDVDDSKVSASVEEILKSALSQDLSLSNTPSDDTLMQQKCSDEASTFAVASTSAETDTTTTTCANGGAIGPLHYLHNNRSSTTNHYANSCETDGKTTHASDCRCANESDCGLDAKLLNSVEIVVNNSSNAQSTTVVNSVAEKSANMAVKHKLDDSKVVEATVATKVPKLDCENDASVKATAASLAISPSTVNGSLVNGTPGLHHHHHRSASRGSSNKSVNSDAKLLSPKRETSSRSGAGGTAVSETASSGGLPSGLGCFPVAGSNVGGSLNGLHQSLSSSDLEQRLLIASKGSVFPGLLTPGVSAAPSAAYFHTEMHQHQHTHMHQYPPPFLSPFAGQLPFGLPSYQPLPGLPVPPMAAPLPNLSTGLSNMQLPQHKKKGRWCAMHVQIAWDIHNRTKSRRESKKSDDNLATSNCADANVECSSASTSRHNSSNNTTAANASGGHKTNHSANNSSMIKTENTPSSGDNANSGFSAIVENKTDRHRHYVEKEKSTSVNSNHSRSDSRASVASVKSTHMLSSGSVDKERTSSVHMSHDGGFSTAAVSSASVSDALQMNAVAKSGSSSIHDGLLYRQREMQERVQQQANSLAAADNFLRSAAAAAVLDFRPPFPFAATAGMPVPYSTAASFSNGHLIPGGLTPGAAAAAALQSRLNLLNSPSFDALRLRPPGFGGGGGDPFRGFVDQFNIGRLPFNADALLRPPPLDSLMMDNADQTQLFQGQQQQSSTPNNNGNNNSGSNNVTNHNGNANSNNGANNNSVCSTNPLAQMIDSERASTHRTSSSQSVLPGLMPLSQFNVSLPQVLPPHSMPSMLPSLDSSTVAAFYSNLLQQQQHRERLEMEQRGRVLNYNPLAAAAGLSLMQPAVSSISSFLPGGGGGFAGALPPGSAPNFDFLRMAGMFGAGDPLLAARTFSGFPSTLGGFSASILPPTNMTGHPGGLPPHPLSAAAMNNNSSMTQGNSNNKLLHSNNNNSFSVTLQQMVAARRDSQMNNNQSSTPHGTMQNR